MNATYTYIDIYKISHPLTMVVLYVGYSKNIKNRIEQHKKCLHSDIGKELRSIMELGLSPLVETLERCVISDAAAVENSWIDKLRNPFMLNSATKQGTQPIRERKTRWSFHSFGIGNTKTVKRHELANFRSALNAWNKNNSALVMTIPYCLLEK